MLQEYQGTSHHAAGYPRLYDKFVQFQPADKPGDEVEIDGAGKGASHHRRYSRPSVIVFRHQQQVPYDYDKGWRDRLIMENNSPKCIAKNIIRALDHPDLEQIACNARALVGGSSPVRQQWRGIEEYWRT